MTGNLPELIRRELRDAADVVGPLDAHERGLRRRIRARRRGQATLALAAVSAVVTLGSWFTLSVVQMRPEAAVTGIPAPGIGSASGPGDHGRAFPCGAAIGAPTARLPTDAPVQIEVSAPQPAPQGALEVTVTITASRPSGISLPLSATPTRLLVLRQGRIVAGQDIDPPAAAAPDAGPKLDGGQGNGEVVRVTPNHPYRAKVSIPPAAVCPGYTWSALWADAARLDLALIAPMGALLPGLPATMDEHDPDGPYVLRQPLARTG